MNSLIDRQYVLDTIFKQFDIREMYGKPLKTPELNLMNNDMYFIILSHKKFKVNPLIKLLAPYYYNALLIKVVTNRSDPNLQGFRLLWKDGHWFV